VEINKVDQAEFWGSFRVARRGHPLDVAYTPAAGGFQLEGWHDGYCRLPGKPRHHRRFNFQTRPLCLEIHDRVQASKQVSAASYIHLHPDISIIGEDTRKFILSGNKYRLNIEFFGEGDISVEDTFYCPSFGVSLPTKQLVIRNKGDFLNFGYRLRMLY